MNYKGQNLEQLLVDYGGKEVFAMSVYSTIFQLGSHEIQCSGEQRNHKPNPIILGSWNDKIRREIMLEDTFEEQLEKFQNADWAILNGLTYWGRYNRANLQGKIYAFMFDLDGITPKTFNNFLHAAFNSDAVLKPIYPFPNYVIMSGTNVHLYYLLEEPLSLYPNVKTELKKLKYGLIRKIWNMHTSTIEKPQYQGINQGFRVIGSKTKQDGIVRAFLMNTHPVSIHELNMYVPKEYEANIDELTSISPRLTLDKAKELYPQWYEQVIEQGIAATGKWHVKEDLYNWWLNVLQECKQVTFGHRYFCIMALAIFAAKCNILDKERVRKDAINLIPTFNEIRPDEPFTERDIDSALDCLDLRYCTFPRRDIEKITAISMPANKRNGRKQEVHLAGARAIQKINDEANGTNWRDGNGRPKGSKNKNYSKRDLILNYKKEHPNANHSEIARALNISRPTVIKWLKSEQK